MNGFNKAQPDSINSRLSRLNVSGMSFLMSPPEDFSDKTMLELELIENIGRRIKEEDKETILRYDGNVLEEYFNILDQFSLNCDKTEIEELINDIKIIVIEEKEKHNRLRPSSLGETQSFIISEEFKQKDDSSSYPSSHATESMFLSLFLGESFPLYKNVFMELAKNISNSRLLSSMNYPTDNLAGHTLANVLFTRYNKEGNTR